MQTLITPTVVVARAFADGEYVAPETVSEAAIVAAQETYLRPVTGDALFERLLAGDHADFTDEYLAAPLALYVRYLIAPQLDLRHGQGGTVQPRSDGFAAASDATLRRSRRACSKPPAGCCGAPPTTSNPTPRSSRSTTRRPTSSTAVRSMENLYRPVSGAAAALAGWFAPIVPLVACVFGFIAVDFLTGVAASRAVARREGRPWWFESAEAWRTVQKLALVATGIVMAWAVDRHVLDFMDLHAARLFTGFACGVEFWSFLENAAQLSDAPLFRWLKRYVRRRMRKEAGDV